jgi:hypothetical protein
MAVHARGVRNLGSLTAPDTSVALSTWVGQRGDLDLIVWFAREDPSLPTVQTHVFAGSAADRPTLEAAMRVISGF